MGEQENDNDLSDFMLSLTQEVEHEYLRIQKHATEDPGTAGDQGEENWATIFRDWLPPIYHVVTKGRILNPRGELSPQIDVLILHPAYPKKLFDKKHYLSGGVVAAFECKLTLKAHHITEALKCSVKTKGLISKRVGSPYKELNCPIIYGLLVHSHSWKEENSTPIDNISKSLYYHDKEIIQHPRDMLDVLCVADLATWTAKKMIFFGPNQFKFGNDLSLYANSIKSIFGPDGSASTSYTYCSKENPRIEKTFTPVGRLITYLLAKLAWENPEIRPIADHFNHALPNAGLGFVRTWPKEIYSDEIRDRIIREPLNFKPWDEWSDMFWL